jgi:hypothetical protein
MIIKQDGIYTEALTDGVLRGNTGQQLVLKLTKRGGCYIGTFDVGVNADWSVLNHSLDSYN